MATYLIDYENVYIEGLHGMDKLTQEDSLHIFYTQNRCGLTFGLYKELTACKAAVHLNEVAISLKNSDPVKNALDIQLMMYAGYLIGTKAPGEIYIVSKDKDFLLGTGFYEQYIREEGICLQLVSSIEESFAPPVPEAEEQPQEVYTAFLDSLEQQLDAEPETEAEEEPESFASLCERYAKPLDVPPPMGIVESMSFLPETPLVEETDPMFSVQYHNTVRNLLGKNTDEETVSRVCEMISVSESLVDFNNALAKFYRDGQRAKVVYHKFKPRFEDLRYLSRASARKQ